MEKTLLQMVFRVTPLFPADIDPELRGASFSQLSTPPSSSTTVADKGTEAPSSSIIKSRPTSEGKRTGDFISCSDDFIQKRYSGYPGFVVRKREEK